MPKLDAVVVGSGPAGLEAALNLRIRKKEFLLFGTPKLSRKIEKAPRINNYLGLPDITGEELVHRFQEHLEQMEIQVTAEQVSGIYPMGSFYSIATNRSTYEARAIILATGAFQGELLPGEERLLGRGVGYCATCDAPLYKGKRVAVLGWTDEAVHEANFVSEIAGTVYYLPVRSARAPLAGAVKPLSGRVTEISGKDRVEALVLDSGPVEVDGVFVLRETIAPDTLVPGLRLEDGYIRVDSDMRTNLEGCFAAGDCTGKPHQYIRAAGQGQTAALGAVAWLDKGTAGE